MAMTLGTLAAVAFGFFLLAAVFSGCETALTAASRLKLQELERRGSRKAHAVLKLVAQREAVAGALLLGKYLALLAAAALVVNVLALRAGTGGTVYAVVIVAAIALIFVELLPKMLAILFADEIALMAAPVLRPLLTPLSLVVMAAETATKRLVQWSGGKLPANQDILTAHQELRSTIDLHHTEGAVVKKDRDMLGGILDLSQLEVSDVMIHRTKMLSFDIAKPVGGMLDDILKSGHTRIPVWKDNPDNIVGILNAKDLFAELHKNGGDVTKVKVEDITSAPWFVPGTRPLSDQLSAFLRRRSHFAIVVDEYGEMMGIVTLEDIIEEIVGEISDEHDSVAAGVRQQPDGSFIMDGTVPVRDINRILDWSLPDAEATTIAGLVIHEARMIPVTGQIFTFHGFRFEVLRKRRHQIVTLRVTPLNR
jgi:Mg2+/Co2+ transporter CorB